MNKKIICMIILVIFSSVTFFSLRSDAEDKSKQSLLTKPVNPEIKDQVNEILKLKPFENIDEYTSFGNPGDAIIAPGERCILGDIVRSQIDNICAEITMDGRDKRFCCKYNCIYTCTEDDTGSDTYHWVRVCSDLPSKDDNGDSDCKTMVGPRQGAP